MMISFGGNITWQMIADVEWLHMYELNNVYILMATTRLS